MFDIYGKILKILSPRERVQFYALIGLILISGIADTVGVASILPFLAVVANPETIQENEILRSAYAWLEPASQQVFLYWLGVAVCCAILGALSIRVATLYALARFANMRRYHIAKRLFEAYLRQPYDWFLRRHSSDLIKTILQEVDQMMGGGFMPAMRILAQAVSVLFLLIFLIVVEPGIAIGAAVVLGGSYALIYMGVRRMLTRFGQERIAANTARNRVANEAFGGIKDVKLMGLEDTHINQFRRPAYRMARIAMIQQVIAEVPRYSLEAITFGGMIVVVLVLLQNGDGALTSVLPILGLLGVAGLRILPALQQVYHLLSLLRGGRPIFDLIVEELETLQKSAAANAVVGAGKDQILKLDTELSLEDVVYAYPETNRSVLAGLSLTIPVNTTVGIVGGTGAGKTTAIDVLLGLLFPQSGTIKVDDTPVERKTLRAWQNNVGYVPQQIFLVDATVAANIAFGVPEHEIDMDAVERAARLAELHDFVTGELENGYLEEVGERGIRLSGGQRQRIGIARALYHDPQVLILDEATSALDNLTERAVMDAVHNLGDSKTIIMIAHRLTTVQNCDQIFLLERGKLAAQGRYEELVETNATFREMARMVS